MSFPNNQAEAKVKEVKYPVMGELTFAVGIFSEVPCVQADHPGVYRTAEGFYVEYVRQYTGELRKTAYTRDEGIAQTLARQHALPTRPRWKNPL